MRRTTASAASDVEPGRLRSLRRRQLYKTGVCIHARGSTWTDQQALMDSGADGPRLAKPASMYDIEVWRMLRRSSGKRMQECWRSYHSTTHALMPWDSLSAWVVE
jgi:hypothetical protein